MGNSFLYEGEIVCINYCGCIIFVCNNWLMLEVNVFDKKIVGIYVSSKCKDLLF